MSLEGNRVVVRRFIEEMMSGQRVECIEDFVAAGAVHHERTADVDYQQALHSVFDDPEHGWQFTVEDLIAEGDMVVARCTASYVASGYHNELGVAYVPGTRATVWHAHFFRLRDGLIVEHWLVREIWDAVKQFNAPTRERSDGARAADVAAR
jgi:predicted ester cyclase